MNEKTINHRDTEEKPREKNKEQKPFCLLLLTFSLLLFLCVSVPLW